MTTPERLVQFVPRTLRNPILALVLASTTIVAGCIGGSTGSDASHSATAPTGGLLSQSWDAISTAARADGSVTLVMWGGSDQWNGMIDDHVAPRLKELYGVRVDRVPIADTPEAVTKILAEKQTGAAGSYDVVWINGENFRKLDEAGALFGPIQPALPSFDAYYDETAFATDFGYPTRGYEAPWGRAQFTMIYDSAKVSEPPTTLDELRDWIKANPGRFTYPAPGKPGGARGDFTGSAFVRTVMLGLSEDPDAYVGSYDPHHENAWSKTYAWLNDVEPYLWREGQTYPQALSDLDRAFADGEVWMTMDYSPTKAEAQIKDGVFPPTTRTFVFDSGTVSNTHFLAIPFNAPHKAAALALIDFLESPEAQLVKYDPAVNGDFPALDVRRLPHADRAKFDAIELGESVLPLDVLAAHALAEPDSRYVTSLEQGWLKNVLEA